MSTVVDPDTGDQVSIEQEAPGEPETLACPNCGAPTAAWQLMCLDCGARLALAYERPAGWRLPAAIVAFVLLLAGLGIGIAVLAADNDSVTTTTAVGAAPQSAPADSAPTTSTATPAPTTSATTPAPAPGTPTGTTATATPTPTPAPPVTATSGWPPGKSAFTVVLASLPSQAAANQKLQAARSAGIGTAAILHSDDFPTLRPGYWVVFDGQFDAKDQADAQAASDRGKGEFGDAYSRFVSKDPNAKP